MTTYWQQNIWRSLTVLLEFFCMFQIAVFRVHILSFRACQSVRVQGIMCYV